MTTEMPHPSTAALEAQPGFIISSSVLKKHVASLLQFVSNNPIVPILENIHVVVAETEAVFTSSNLQNTLALDLPIERIEGQTEWFSFCVPAKRLQKLVSKLPEQPLTIRFNADQEHVMIVAYKSKFKLPTEKADDFPKLPSPTLGAGKVVPAVFELDSEVLTDVLTKAVSVTSTDDLRPAMTGVYITSNFAGAEVAATDGHRLLRLQLPSFAPGSDLKFILPRQTSSGLLNVLPNGSNETVKVEVTNTQARFAWPGRTLTCRIIDERFPDYINAIPTNNPIKVVLKRRAVLAILSRMKDFANGTTSQISVALQEGEIVFRAEDDDWKTSAEESLDATIANNSQYELSKSNPFVIGFNARILHNSLSIIKTDKIEMQFSSHGRACLVHPYEDGTINENMMMLVMPVMLASYAW